MILDANRNLNGANVFFLLAVQLTLSVLGLCKACEISLKIIYSII